MKKMTRNYETKWAILLVALILCTAACSDDDSSTSGATVTGTVSSFVAALDVKNETMLAKIKKFLSPRALAQASGVTVSIGNQSATTDASGNFELLNISPGDQVVTFTQNSSSATYSLKDVDANETFTLNSIQISGSVITTEHTGTWTGTISSSDLGATLPMTATIAANGNTLNATATNGSDTWNITGTENGTSIEGTSEVTGGPCVGDGATFSGTFSDNTFNGTYESPGGVCNASTGTITLTKS